MAQSNADRQAAYRERNKSNVTPRERAPRRNAKLPTVAALRKDCASILEMANSFAYALGLAADALTEEEIALLANGLAHELHSHPEWVRKLSEMMSGVSAHGIMAAAVLAIALPRLSRRGVVPWTVAQPLTGIAYMVAGSTPNAHEGNKQPTPDPSLSVETGSAPSAGGRHGEWEEHFSGEAA